MLRAQEFQKMPFYHILGAGVSNIYYYVFSSTLLDHENTLEHNNKIKHQDNSKMGK